MNSAYNTSGPGGFLTPSPSASSTASVTNGSFVLPNPRGTPLKGGSSKESSFINYVDAKLLGISRRYEKRFNADLEDDVHTRTQDSGYEDFEEMGRDLEIVIDVSNIGRLQ